MTKFHNQTRALTELGTVLRLVDAGKLSVAVRTRLPKSATVRLLEDYFAGEDFACEPVRAIGWCCLLQAAGLAAVGHSRLNLTDDGRRALSAEPAETLRGVWQRWLGSSEFDLFERLGPLRLKGKRALIKPSTRRRAVAGLVEALETGRWHQVDELLEQARASGARLEVVRDLSRVYVAEPTLGSLLFLGEEAAWSLVAGRYLACALMEVLGVLGMVDLRSGPAASARNDFQGLLGAEEMPYLTRYDGLQAVRLTPLGSYCLGAAEAYSAAPAAGRARVEGRELVFDSPPSACENLLLELFCRPASKLRYRLDMTRTLQAAARGHSPTALRGLIGDKAEEFLAEAEQRTGAVRCRGRAYLFTCNSPVLRSRLLESAETGRFCSPAGPDQVVVAPDELKRFRKGLLQLGYQA